MESVSTKSFSSRAIRWAALFAWSGAILLFTLTSGDWFKEWLLFFIKISRDLDMPSYTPAKLFHFSAYAIWALMLAGAVKGKYFAPPRLWEYVLFAAITLCFGALQEGLQLLNPCRRPSGLDVLINFSGGVFGLLIIKAAELWKNFRNKPASV